MQIHLLWQTSLQRTSCCQSTFSSFLRAFPAVCLPAMFCIDRPFSYFLQLEQLRVPPLIELLDVLSKTSFASSRVGTLLPAMLWLSGHTDLSQFRQEEVMWNKLDSQFFVSTSDIEGQGSNRMRTTPERRLLTVEAAALHSLQTVFCWVFFLTYNIGLRVWNSGCGFDVCECTFCRDGGKWRCFKAFHSFSRRLCLPEFEGTNWFMIPPAWQFSKNVLWPKYSHRVLK